MTKVIPCHCYSTFSKVEHPPQSLCKRNCTMIFTTSFSPKRKVHQITVSCWFHAGVSLLCYETGFFSNPRLSTPSKIGRMRQLKINPSFSMEDLLPPTSGAMKPLSCLASLDGEFIKIFLSSDYVRGLDFDSSQSNLQSSGWGNIKKEMFYVYFLCWLICTASWQWWSTKFARKGNWEYGIGTCPI